MLGSLYSILILLLLVPPAFAQPQETPSQTTARSVRCRLDYTMAIRNLAKGEINSGMGEAHCYWGAGETITTLDIYAYNQEEWPREYVESGSLEGIGEIKPNTFINAILTAPKGAGNIQGPVMSQGNYFKAAFLTAPQLVQSQLSVVLQKGDDNGFALSRGFQNLVFAERTGSGIMFNRAYLRINPTCYQVRKQGEDFAKSCILPASQ